MKNTDNNMFLSTEEVVKTETCPSCENSRAKIVGAMSDRIVLVCLNCGNLYSPVSDLDDFLNP